MNEYEQKLQQEREKFQLLGEIMIFIMGIAAGIGLYKAWIIL